MKRTALFSLILFLVTIIYSSCREDVYADWKLQNEQWYQKHKNDSGFVQTSSGLCYKVIHQGYQRKPNSSSYIIATYKGKLIDGSTFDSGTEAYLGKVSGLVPGFQEGLKKMNGGGYYIFYIPSKIGYDTVSTNAAIPPHSNLIFEVELIDSY
ncbi:MAG: FKBP-type peptidyl-prolyl cis-trans isomerase [Paludibacter sp.]|nr:FKBP-type peptidyl-prolyl cis-trans isomerase [Paludibacter sp.]